MGGYLDGENEWECSLFISALNKSNLAEFRQRAYAAIRDIHITRFPTTISSTQKV